MPMFLKAIPATEKCFLHESIDDKATLTEASCLRGEEFHFALAFTTDDAFYGPRAVLLLEAESSLPFTIEQVELVPVRQPVYPGTEDPDFLSKEPGMYPDLLVPLTIGERIYVPRDQLRSAFVTVRVPETAAAGEYPLTFRFREGGGRVAAETTFTLHVLPATLPKQTLKVTEWFHCDCIASYYNLEIFSETHWSYIENFLRTAVENGINTILMPVFTPPLDTNVGGERPTVQLVDVEKDGDGWHFGFDKVERWVAMCNRVGVEYFEVSHLFTQWGAGHAPKIVGKVDGKLQKIFGWETDSRSAEYTGFLRAFLTAFLAKMKSLGGADRRCMFHISDEPGFEHLEQYRAVKESIADLLEGYPIMDALSNFSFYETGAISHPIPSNDHITPFLEAGVPDLWTYYCCGQYDKVSNRFLAMPMSRTRIIGLQMWKYRIAGFLQWGYNFWYSQGSAEVINPFVVTDGNYFFPAGDGYAVYPGPAGVPYTSLHMKAFTAALYDMRALQLAESLVGREAVLAVVEEGLSTPITFAEYPREKGYIPSMREKLNALIAAAATAGR